MISTPLLSHVKDAQRKKQSVNSSFYLFALFLVTFWACAATTGRTRTNGGETPVAECTCNTLSRNYIDVEQGIGEEAKGSQNSIFQYFKQGGTKRLEKKIDEAKQLAKSLASEKKEVSPKKECTCKEKKCKCKKKSAPSKKNCNCKTGGKKNPKTEEGGMEKWTEGKKSGKLTKSQNSDIKHAYKDEEKEKHEQQKSDDHKKKVQKGEKIEGDNPAGFEPHKKIVNLPKADKKKDDDAMVMIRRPQRLRKNDKTMKPAINWEPTKKKKTSSKNVNKVDGENAFFQSKLQPSVPQQSESNSADVKKLLADGAEASLAEKKIVTEYNIPNGNPVALEPKALVNFDN